MFAHGIWADGSSFSKVIPTLQGEGHEVIAAQFGLDTLAGDVTAVRNALGRVSSPVILVGHSDGGTLVTAAGTDPHRQRKLCRCMMRPERSTLSSIGSAESPCTLTARRAPVPSPRRRRDSSPAA